MKTCSTDTKMKKKCWYLLLHVTIFNWIKLAKLFQYKTKQKSLKNTEIDQIIIQMRNYVDQALSANFHRLSSIDTIQ